MATHSSILAWEISWTEEPGGLEWGHKESDMTERLSTHHGPTSIYDTYTEHLKRPLRWVSHHFFQNS